MTLHILPVDDLKEHIQDGPCFCNPDYLSGDNRGMYDEIIVVHNALDGREWNEMERGVSHPYKEE